MLTSVISGKTEINNDLVFLTGVDIDCYKRNGIESDIASIMKDIIELNENVFDRFSSTITSTLMNLLKKNGLTIEELISSNIIGGVNFGCIKK